MAFEISLEVYTFRIRNKADKDIFLPFSNFIQGEHFLKFCQDFLSKYRSISVSKKQKKSLQITDQVSISSGKGILSGILKSGEFGVESTIADQEGNEKYIKSDDDLDIKPFYFLIWVPNDSDVGILITQRLGFYGVYGLFTSRLIGSLQEKYPDLTIDFSSYVSKDYARKFIEEGLVKEIILKRYQLPSDVATQFNNKFDVNHVKQIEFRIIADNRTYFGLNDKLKNYIENPNARFFTIPELNNIGFDGEHREFIKFKLGKTTRTIDISHIVQLKPYFDIDSEVEKEKGHPVFESIDEIARNLLEDFEEEMFKRK